MQITEQYVQGLLTAYGRVLGYIDDIDPESLSPSFEILKTRIQASLFLYDNWVKKLSDFNTKILDEFSDMDSEDNQEHFDNVIPFPNENNGKSL